jgi:hypothetical protein
MSRRFYISAITPIPLGTNPNMTGGRARRAMAHSGCRVGFNIMVILRIRAGGHPDAQNRHKNKFTHRFSFFKEVIKSRAAVRKDIQDKKY